MPNVREQIHALALTYGIDLLDRGTKHLLKPGRQRWEKPARSTLPRWTHQVDETWWIAINETTEPWQVRDVNPGGGVAPFDLEIPAGGIVVLRDGRPATDLEDPAFQRRLQRRCSVCSERMGADALRLVSGSRKA